MVNRDVFDLVVQFELVITHVFTADNLADANGDRELMSAHFEQEITMAFAEWDIDIQLDKDIKHSNEQHHSFMGCLQRSFANIDELNSTEYRNNKGIADVSQRDNLQEKSISHHLEKMKNEVIQCCEMITFETMLVSFKLLDNV
ncbi:MAG: hypothetical protein WBG74_03835 [Shewanella sp.]|uniref:hypothetical protein n=1 Tax=Shewanella sp. TaxID=50422 RepID=UPI003C706A80